MDSSQGGHLCLEGGQSKSEICRFSGKVKYVYIC